MTDSIKITVYRWAGRRLFFRVRSECMECDLTVAKVRSLVSAHPDWPVVLEVKPWLTHLWESLRHGGWHAPVVLVDGRLLSQGKIPTRAELELGARRAFERRGISPSQQEKMPAVSQVTSSER